MYEQQDAHAVREYTTPDDHVVINYMSIVYERM